MKVILSDPQEKNKFMLSLYQHIARMKKFTLTKNERLWKKSSVNFTEKRPEEEFPESVEWQSHRLHWTDRGPLKISKLHVLAHIYNSVSNAKLPIDLSSVFGLAKTEALAYFYIPSDQVNKIMRGHRSHYLRSRQISKAPKPRSTKFLERYGFFDAAPVSRDTLLRDALKRSRSSEEGSAKAQSC